MQEQELEQEVARRRPWWQKPIWVGLLGLALMIAGWQLSQYVPSSPRHAAQAEQLAEVRRLAEDPALAERLDRLAQVHQTAPPFELPGRLLFFGGLLLFIGAGVQMARQPDGPAPPETPESPSPDR